MSKGSNSLSIRGDHDGCRDGMECGYVELKAWHVQPERRAESLCLLLGVAGLGQGEEAYVLLLCAGGKRQSFGEARVLLATMAIVDVGLVVTLSRCAGLVVV